MTLEEAIKLLTLLRDLRYIELGGGFKEALGLGIEALKEKLAPEEGEQQ